MAILKDKTKKKKGENIIGKIIYGFLLFMPLIAVGVACFYVMFNKNAFESYTYKEEVSNVQIVGSYTTKEQEITIVAPSTLHNQYDTGTHVFNINGSAIKTRPAIINEIWEITDDIEITNYQIGMAQNGQQINLMYGGAWHNKSNLWGQTIKELTFTFNAGTEITGYNDNTTNYYAFIYKYTQANKLDNVFYYQLERLEESDLFNWTKNTGAYTVMHNVTSGIGISNTYTPMLMTYWLLISVIYFIFDIALILVWAVHDKIHELKDAI